MASSSLCRVSNLADQNKTPIEERIASFVAAMKIWLVVFAVALIGVVLVLHFRNDEISLWCTEHYPSLSRADCVTAAGL